MNADERRYDNYNFKNIKSPAPIRSRSDLPFFILTGLTGYTGLLLHIEYKSPAPIVSPRSLLCPAPISHDRPPLHHILPCELRRHGFSEYPLLLMLIPAAGYEGRGGLPFGKLIQTLNTSYDFLYYFIIPKVKPC